MYPSLADSLTQRPLEKWAECNGVESRHTLPVQVFPVALYLVSLIQTANTPSPVFTALYSIKSVHKFVI